MKLHYQPRAGNLIGYLFKGSGPLMEIARLMGPHQISGFMHGPAESWGGF